MGSAQDGAEATMAAPNLQAGETGWEKSPDGVMPSLEKGQEPFRLQVSLQTDYQATSKM